MRRLRFAILHSTVLCAALASRAAPLPQWTNVGPEGGAASVAADPVDPNHVVVLDRGDNVFETHDRGATWTQGSIPACNGPSQIAGGAYYEVCRSGVARTTDGGNSWSAFGPQALTPSAQFTSLTFDPSNSANAMLGAYDAGSVLFDSRDGGRSWSGPYASAGFTPSMFAFDPTQPGRLLALATMPPPGAATTYQLQAWESRNFGGTWQQVGIVNQWDSSQIGCYGGSFAVDSAGRWYLTTQCGVQVSTTGGRTWSLAPLSDAGLSPGSLGSLRIDPSTRGHIAISGLPAMYETRDGGATWTSSPLPNGTAPIDFAADGAVWAADPKGVYRRDPGLQGWVPVAIHQLRSASPGQVAIGGSDARVLMTGENRSTDGGDTWSASSAIGSVIPVLGQPLQFYTLSGATLLLSKDAGATWQSTVFTNRAPSGESIGNLAPVGPQPGVIYANSLQRDDCFDLPCYQPHEVLRSADGGVTWSSIDGGLSGTGRAIALFASDPAVLYVSTSAGAFRSTDSGAHWQLLATPARGAVIPDAVDRSTLYQWTATALSVTTDAGAHWTSATVPNARGRAWLIADPAQAGRAYMVAEDGTAFETLDRAASWRQVSVGAGLSFLSYQQPTVAVAGADRMIAGVANNSLYALRVSGDSLVLDTDLWWDPAEPGWGVSIAQHQSGNLFAVWYRYDAQGQPTWSVIPGGSWLDSRTFAGTLYTTTGPGFFDWVGSYGSQVHATAVGQGTIVFDDADSADVTFTMTDGTSFQHHVVRQRYGSASHFSGTNVSDLWWNPTQSGWGIQLSQQFGTIFATWFVYDEQRRPTWLTIPAMQATNFPYSGDVYATTGPPSTGPFDPSKVVATKVGTVFLGATIVPVNLWPGTLALSFTAYGHTGTATVTRQPF